MKDKMPAWTKDYKKAVTFSYDDGNLQDRRLVELLNRYHLKATFNVNSGLDETNGSWLYLDKYPVSRFRLEDTVDLYKGHEVAVHSLTHPDLTKLSKAEIKKELEEDQKNIARIFGDTPVGMAHPYGTYSDEVGSVMKELGLLYGRGVWESHSFAIPTDLLCFRPTCHHDDEKVLELIQEFLASEQTEPQLLYIWGHSYEFDGKNNWDHMEKICEMVSGKKDIFYGTNKEVLL